MFFTVDTMMAGIVFTLTVVVVLSFFVNKPIIEDTKAYIDNYVSYITETKMIQYRTSYRFIYDDSNEPHPDLAVYQKVYVLVSNDQNETARSFINNFTRAILPDHVGVEYMIDDNLIYNRTTVPNESIRSSLSTSILTYFFNGASIQGPSITRITVWT